MDKNRLKLIGLALRCEDSLLVDRIDEETWVGGLWDRQFTEYHSVRTDGVVQEIGREPDCWRTLNGSAETRYNAARRTVRAHGGTYLIVEGRKGADCALTAWEYFTLRVTPECDEAKLMEELHLTEEDLLAAEHREAKRQEAARKEAEAERARKRRFAMSTRKVLRDGGLTDETISRLFKEAGPAAALAGGLWALGAITTEVTDTGYSQVGWGSPRYDLALILVTGALERAPGGWERTAAAFAAAGFAPISGRAAFQRRALEAAKTSLLSREVAGGETDYWSAYAATYEEEGL